MSQRQMTSEIDKILTGLEVAEAVPIVVDHIMKQQKFKEHREAAYGYWSGLSRDEKVELLAEALRSKR